MTEEVKRNYLEIRSLQELNEEHQPLDGLTLNLVDPLNFQLNRFFYKTIGKKHKWKDRLIWDEQQWINYVSNKKVKTSQLIKIANAGHLLHEEKSEIVAAEVRTFYKFLTL